MLFFAKLTFEVNLVFFKISIMLACYFLFMPSIKRGYTYNSIHHIYNRGVLKKNIFHSNADYNKFIARMDEYKAKYPIDLQAFCLMPNHFHFIIRETGQLKPIISKFMQQLQNAYARYYAVKYGHSGRLFQGVYKNKRIRDEIYYDVVKQYIKYNPVKDGLVDAPKKWKYLGGAALDL